MVSSACQQSCMRGSWTSAALCAPAQLRLAVCASRRRAPVQQGGPGARAPCRILKEERNHILGLVKKIKASGCNVLLVQKSILRDATTDLSLHFLVRTCCGSACLPARCIAECVGWLLCGWGILAWSQQPSSTAAGVMLADGAPTQAAQTAGSRCQPRPHHQPAPLRGVLPHSSRHVDRPRVIRW